MSQHDEWTADEFAAQQREAHVESLNRLADNLSKMSRIGERLAERLHASAEQLERGEVPDFKAKDIPGDDDNKEHTQLFMAHGEACGTLLQLVLAGCTDPFNENQQEFTEQIKQAKAKREKREREQASKLHMPRGMCKRCGNHPQDPFFGGDLCGFCKIETGDI